MLRSSSAATVPARDGLNHFDLEERTMKSMRKSVTACWIAIVLAFYPILALAAATPIRHPSGYGEESNAAFWNLLGPTDLVTISGLKMRLQVRCPNQDVGADSTNAGGCTSGAYLFMFQIPSGPKDLEVTFSSLFNFSFPNDANGNPTVGVMECDDPTGTVNTASLCTNTTATSSDITFRQNGTKDITFLIPEIPNYPRVPCTVSPSTVCHQGQGLTLFVQQGVFGGNAPAAFPIGFPSITVKTGT
jgi:hypothetical protein